MNNIKKDIRICDNCGKLYEVSEKHKKFPKRFCCYRCYEKWTTFNKKPNCKCVVCGKPMYMKQTRLDRLKNHKITCSNKCSNILRSDWMKGENNHQFGLRGELNSSYKNYDSLLVSNYVMTPNKLGKRKLKHRKLIEDNWERYDEKYFSIDETGARILKDEYIVHHINGIKSDNRLENLQIMTRAEHSKFHSKIDYHSRTIDSLGRFMKKSGVDK